MGKIRVDVIMRTIYISKSFEKKARSVNSLEYQELHDVMAENPNFKICLKEVKKKENKKAYKGLTYDFMRDYIWNHESDETRKTVMDEFDEMILISQCHNKAFRYPTIKKWFLNKYPEVEMFGYNIQTNEKQALEVAA